MKLLLKNIGLINDCEILLDGLTVITGFNSTGKSTIGKTMYSLISSVENLQENALKDKNQYAFRIINEVINELKLYRYIELEIHKCETIQEAVYKIYVEGRFTFNNVVELYNFVDKFSMELREFNFENLSKLQKSKMRVPFFMDIVAFNKIKDIQLSKLSELCNLLEPTSDLESIRYVNYKIQKTFDIEFNNQICKMGLNNDLESNITLIENDSTYFNVNFRKNKINLGIRNYFYSSINNAVFIDDVYIIDSISNYKLDNDVLNSYRSTKIHNNVKEFFETVSSMNHNLNLIRKLKMKNENIYSEMHIQNSINKLMEKINVVLPNDIYFSKDKFVYSDKELDVRNLATGMKIYSILKMLLQNGQIKNDTLLIFDEPESHLHPEWQNIFAEIIVILVKELKAKVILTTHSPNFLLAIDIYVKKYEIQQETNFYKTKKYEEDFTLINITDSIEEAYFELSNPFFKLEDFYYNE